jgi:glyoxalase family protein
MKPIQGLHHITAVAGDPQRNVDFYEQVLGQRLVKRTVNFDDPGTYHFYYGDYVGTPGTILTFFPWSRMSKGRRGAGETATVSYAISPGSMTFWEERLASFEIGTTSGGTRFGDQVLQFEDPDGMVIELVASDAPATFRYWEAGPVAKVHALHGFHSVSLWLNQVEPTAQLLTEQLGYTFEGQEGDRHRFRAASDDIGLFIDIVHRPDEARGAFGRGSIHHIAFRTVDDEEQLEYMNALHDAGQQVTPVQDRQYFHSIYFREPGGVLFEVATDAPGFAYDEALTDLGDSLKLPSWLEPRRAQIERILPAFERKHDS